MCSKVLELYSGIGGVHFAFNKTQLKYEIVFAIDINSKANMTYSANFNQTNIKSKLIETFTVDQLNKLDFDTLTLSPPCQPFTRLGNYKDDADLRCKSLHFIIDIIPQLKIIPKYILLENVKGFEQSKTHQKLISMLNSLNYHYQEYLLSPKQFGIPNSRLRYYLIARNYPFKFSNTFEPKEDQEGINKPCTIFKEFPNMILEQLLNKFPDNFSGSLNYGNGLVIYKVPSSLAYYLNLDKSQRKSTNKIRDNTLNNISLNIDETYNLEAETLAKYINVIDLVYPSDNHSCCFTKGYGRLFKYSGSFLIIDNTSQNDIKENLKNGKDKMDIYGVDYRIRYFKPMEIARLMGFPSDFTIPEGLTRRQIYSLLGNSVSVDVVAIMLYIMIKL